MPYINIRTADAVSVEKKKEVIKQITDVMVNVLGKSPNSVMIMIDEISPDNAGMQGLSLTELRKVNKK